MDVPASSGVVPGMPERTTQSGMYTVPRASIAHGEGVQRTQDLQPAIWQIEVTGVAATRSVWMLVASLINHLTISGLK